MKIFNSARAYRFWWMMMIITNGLLSSNGRIFRVIILTTIVPTLKTYTHTVLWLCIRLVCSLLLLSYTPHQVTEMWRFAEERRSERENTLKHRQSNGPPSVLYARTRTMPECNASIRACIYIYDLPQCVVQSPSCRNIFQTKRRI